MAKHIPVIDPPSQARVALVLFNVAHYRVALESRYVHSMHDHPSQKRAVNAQALLYKNPSVPISQPTYWLTLRDVQKGGQPDSWQLGVSGDITLQQLPVSTIHPLPKLLHSRCFSPALCGFTFDQQQIVLLLDARKLTPESSRSLSRQP